MSIDTRRSLIDPVGTVADPSLPAHAFADALTPELAAVTVARSGGLPAEACTMSSSRTHDLLDRLHILQLHVADGRTGVEDILFDLVPQVQDASLRRSVLKAKRAAHADQPVPEALLATLGELLSSAQSDTIARWSSDARQALRLADQLAASVDADSANAIDQLCDALSDSRFHRSVALAAPDWLRYGKPHRKPRERRNVRTLYSYVSRAAVKTSPFSGLTTVGVAGRDLPQQSLSYASTALAHLAARAYARDEATAHLLRYRLAPIRPGASEHSVGLVLLAEAEADGGLAWRLDRICEADHAMAWVGGWQDGRERTVGELMAGLGGADPFARFRRLFDSGLITLVAPWQRGGDPLQAVADLVAAQDHPIAGQVHEVLDRCRLLRDDDARTRTDVGVQVRSIAAQWAPRAGLDRFDPGELVYEDVTTSHSVDDPARHAGVRADLQMLGRLSRPYLFRSHLYDVLVEAMVAQFGPGGRTTDIPGFLMRLAIDGDSMPALDRASAADQEVRGSISDRALLPVGRTSAPPTMAALYQLSSTESDAVARGDHHLVVNQFNPGAGGLLARFGELLGDHLKAPVREHIRACWPQSHLRELVIWTELNTAQSRSAGMLPALTTSSEVTDRTAPLDLSQVHLVHDAATDTIELRDPLTDVPVGMPYLGLVPPHMFPPYARLLAVLADPWINGSPHSDYVLPYALRAERDDTVHHLPRRTHGRLVTSREAWVVPVDQLPLPDRSESDVALVRRTDAFRRAHGMPREVFVHQMAPTGAMGGTDRKPMWIDLAAPTSAAALAGWLDGATEHVRIVEALPARTDHPARDQQGRPIATEYVNLFRWTRPEEAR